jgi:hypothetical protein
VACNVIIGFWSDIVPTGAIIAIVLVLYAYVDQFLPGVYRCHALAPLGYEDVCSLFTLWPWGGYNQSYY